MYCIEAATVVWMSVPGLEIVTLSLIDSTCACLKKQWIDEQVCE